MVLLQHCVKSTDEVLDMRFVMALQQHWVGSTDEFLDMCLCYGSITALGWIN
jgi:hypothetical protein